MILEYIKLTLLCVWLGHSPLQMDEDPGWKFQWGNGQLLVCERCHFVYWEKAEESK